jgi:hypothetical protein
MEMAFRKHFTIIPMYFISPCIVMKMGHSILVRMKALMIKLDRMKHVDGRQKFLKHRSIAHDNCVGMSILHGHVLV